MYNHNKAQQSKNRACAYFLGYTVYIGLDYVIQTPDSIIMI